jgi:cytochrome c2
MAKKRKGVYYYDIDKLNFFFAILAIATLIGVAWMVWDDYAREWKSFQRQFRVIETEVTQQQLADVQAQVDQQELTRLQEQRDAAEQTLAEQQDALEELEDELASREKAVVQADQEARFARSTYDARRYEYEEAAHESGGDAERQRARMEEAAAEVQETGLRLEEITAERDRVQAELEVMRADLSTAESGLTAMYRDIDRLQQRLDDLRFGVVYAIRNAPMLDALNPSLRIRQAVIEDIPVDLNFADAPRVDRCETCHLGIANPSFEGQQQPFAAHPRLDLFIADTSPHPMGEFGCSSCHLGKDRATSFTSAVHTPDNESEEHRWVDEYGWAPVHLWEWPMRPSYETEASCLKCHMDDTWLPDAPELEYGLGLIETLGCYGCHALERFEDTRKPGPSLDHVGVKTTPEWAYGWVLNPKDFRPNTPMPRFFGNENNSDEYWQVRNVVEADSLVAYVFENSTDIDLDSPSGTGDAERGRQVFESVGCQGCHIAEEPGSEGFPDNEPRYTGYRYRGPNLYGIGSKTNEDWLYTWVRNPKHYWDETVMPNLRLTDTEAADVAAYLMSLRLAGWDDTSLPDVDEALRDDVVLEYLRNQLSTVDAEARLAGMNSNEKRLYLGQQLIARYGCAGCHTIPGFEGSGRIGTDLSEWGSKSVAQLDFGLLDLPHERRAFLEQKLHAPRSYDRGKVKAPQELTRMPNYLLTQREIGAIATTILGYTDEDIPDSKRPEKTPRREAIEAGRALVHEFNCRSCHILEEHGGAIRDVIAEQGMAEGRTRPAALAFAPPNLRTEGAKVQPDWLYRFLSGPSPIRPWLNVRMPSYDFNDEQLNAITQYFAAVDQASYPFDEKFTLDHTWPRDMVRDGERLASDDNLRCFRCHVRAGVTPATDPSQWGPDMALAGERLRFEWLQEWISDPQAIMPGTNMPQYYTNLTPGSSPYVDRGRGNAPILDQDPVRQIEALASYIMALGQR